LLQNQENLQPHELQASVDAFQKAFEDAGWSKTAKKKFHWLQHFSDELRRFGFLPSCWATERKNKLLKLLGTDVLNTQVFDETVLREVVAHDLHRLKTPGLFDASPRLNPPRKASKETFKFLQRAFSQSVDIELESCRQSSQAQLSSSMQCKAGDVVLLNNGSSRWAAGEVLLFVAVSDEAFAVVAQWELESYQPHLLRATWLVLDAVCFVPLQQIWTSLTYTHCRDKRAMTLIPFAHR